jgi:hypothetical protein
MNEGEAKHLWIEQGWIETAGMHLFYQLQVVSNDVYIGVSPTKL